MAGVAQQSGEKIGQQIIGGMVGVLDGGDIQSAGNEQHGTGAVSPASMTAQEWQNDQKPQVCRTFVFLTVDENSIDDQYQVKKQRLSFAFGIHIRQQSKKHRQQDTYYLSQRRQ